MYLTLENASQYEGYAFPKHAIINVRYPYYTQVHRLIDALKYAQTRCASNSLGKCIRWARSVINEEKGAKKHEFA